MSTGKKGKSKKTNGKKKTNNNNRKKTATNKKSVNSKKTTTSKKKQVELSKKDKIISYIKNIIKSDKDVNKLFFIVETLYIFLVEIVVKIILGNLSFSWTLFRILLSSAIISAIITLITGNMNRKLRKAIIIVVDTFITIYAWLQAGFMDFLGAFMSMGNAEQGTKITQYIVDFLGSYKWTTHLIYVPLIFMILYFIFEKRITHNGYNNKVIYNKKNIIKITAAFIITCVVYYSTLTISFMQNKYQTIPNKALFKYAYNPSTTIKNFGSTVYFLIDAKGTLFGGEEELYENNSERVAFHSTSRNIDDTKWKKLIEQETSENYKTLHNYYINRDIPDTNEYTGKFEGKNLIMIMMESIPQAVFNKDLEVYFPTLHKLYNEGITGVNNYSPKNNCATGESEMTSQISLYSIETTCTVNSYRNNVYPEALLNMMKNNDYYTSSYHNYTDHYYYRNTFEYNLGATDYFDVEALEIPFSTQYKEWPSDLALIQKALPHFINKDKFASYMVTVTTHTPYIYSSEYGDLYLSLFENTDYSMATRRYLSKVKVLDTALEDLLKELEEAGKLDDTVIVLFGDHYPYALADDEFQSLADYDINENQETDRTPFIIYNSATDAEKITKVTTPLDYTPTLLNLFGIEYDPRLYMGHDIFSDYDDYAVFPDNSWQSREGFYSSTKGLFIPKNNDISLDDETIISRNEDINTMRNMSALAIRNNYFNYLLSEMYGGSLEESTEEGEE